MAPFDPFLPFAPPPLNDCLAAKAVIEIVFFRCELPGQSWIFTQSL